MVNKSLKKIINLSEVNKIIGLKTNLRPSELKPEVYYKITELFERKVKVLFYLKLSLQFG